MGYSLPPSVKDGNRLTAYYWNTYIKANFEAGVPDIFTTKGDLPVASGADAAGRLPVGANGTVLTAGSGEALGMRWLALARLGADGAGDQTIKAANTTYAAAWVKITAYSTEAFDTAAAYAGGTFTAQHAGHYLIGASGQLTHSSTGFEDSDEMLLAVYKNGSLAAVLNYVAGFPATPAATVAGLSGATMLSLAVGDTVAFYIYHNLATSGAYGMSLRLNSSSYRACVALLR